jgi:hypothetical protein
MAFRILNQDPQFFSADGKSLLVGGSVTFYASGTSTLQNTFTDPMLATPNNNPLTINSQGRIPDVWGNANYRMVVADVLGSIQWTRDNVQGPFILPAQAGKAGDFLSTDGTALAWTAIIQPPSVTGQSGKLLSNDGASMFWAPAGPGLPTGGVTQAANSITIGAIRLQWGSDTLPASGSSVATKSVSFGTAFSSLPLHISLCASVGSGFNASGGILVLSAASRTSTGFICAADSNLGFTTTAFPITATTPFTWFAIGPV